MKKNVLILLFDDVEVLDFAGPFEVFSIANERCGFEAFNLGMLAVKPGTIRARHGLKVVPDFTMENCPPPHFLIIPGGEVSKV